MEEPLVYSGTRVGGPGGGSPSMAALGAVIRRSPPWVCRGLGELLYRYAT